MAGAGVVGTGSGETLGGVMVTVEAVTVRERIITPHGELELRQRSLAKDVQWEITQDGYFVCPTKRSHSAIELIQYGLNALPKESRELKVLIGGLGLGFSLQAALAHPGVAQVDVVEWEKVIIGWNLRFFGRHSKEALMDPRTRLIAGNLLDVLPTMESRYHLIALDIDNGPGGLVHSEKAAGSDDGGFLSVIREHLLPGGALTVWSDKYQEEFLTWLKFVFSQAAVRRVWDKEDDGGPLEAFIYRAIL